MKRIPSHTSTITSKGQVTIPVEIRRRLGLEPGDKVLFEDDGTTVRLRKAHALTLDEIAGSARPVTPGMTVEQAVAAAHDERAQYLVDKYIRAGLKLPKRSA